MTDQELHEILKNPENSRIEFKLDSERPERIAKEIVAFANFRGGKLIFGVDDKTNQIVGISKPGFEEWIMDTVIGRYITPFLIPLYEEINTKNGKLAVISIEQGINKPYFVKEGDRETPYIRIGSISRIANGEQLLRMSQEAGHFHFEISPVSGSSIEDINLELFLHFYEKEFYEKIPFQSIDTIQEKLTQLDLLVTDSFGKISASLVGLILFGKDPGRYIPQVGFRYIHYKNQTIETNHNLDQTITIPLGNIIENGKTIRSGIIESIIQKLSDPLSIEELPDNIHRTRVWKIPPRVLRELAVNAIIHRDYSKKGRNEIRLFSDRLEFESQGRLPNSLTIEKIKAGQKYPRNPILVQFAQYLGLMEHKGLGIRKIVLEEMAKTNLPEPEFIESEDRFLVVLRFGGLSSV
jgi:ATP-dependent DNA helicase RecG